MSNAAVKHHGGGGFDEGHGPEKVAWLEMIVHFAVGPGGNDLEPGSTGTGGHGVASTAPQPLAGALSVDVKANGAVAGLSFDQYLFLLTVPSLSRIR